MNEQLVSNHKNKHIVVSSTAKKVNEMQNKLDDWLDCNNNIDGDTVTIAGSHAPELKLGLTTSFANATFAAKEAYSETELCPRFLIGTHGCIGAGLDCASVNLVTRLGLPTSITHFIQEMGRCGRNGFDVGIFNTFGIVFQLSDYAYLVERLCAVEEDCNDNCTNDNNEPSSSPNNINVMTPNEIRNLQLNNINAL